MRSARVSAGLNGGICRRQTARLSLRRSCSSRSGDAAVEGARGRSRSRSPSNASARAVGRRDDWLSCGHSADVGGLRSERRTRWAPALSIRRNVRTSRGARLGRARSRRGRDTTASHCTEVARVGAPCTIALPPVIARRRNDGSAVDVRDGEGVGGNSEPGPDSGTKEGPGRETSLSKSQNVSFWSCSGAKAAGGRSGTSTGNRGGAALASALKRLPRRPRRARRPTRSSSRPQAAGRRAAAALGLARPRCGQQARSLAPSARTERRRSSVVQYV